MERVNQINAFQSQSIVQQQLKLCRLRSTPLCISAIFYMFGMVYILLYATYGYGSYHLNEYEKRYDDVCEGVKACLINVEITKDVLAPFGVYYKLTNMKQMHRSIASSYSTLMHRGKESTESQIEKCQPRAYMNSTVTAANLYVPCGLLPYTIFNDSISILGFSSMVEDDIALSIDKKDLFKEPSSIYNSSLYWITDSGLFPNGQTDPHYMNWMRQSAFTPFRKLYSISRSQNLPKGNYTIYIANNYHTSLFKGQKYFIISEIRMFSGRKQGSSVTFALMVGIMLLASALTGIVGLRRSRSNSPFNPTNLNQMFVSQ